MISVDSGLARTAQRAEEAGWTIMGVRRLGVIAMMSAMTAACSAPPPLGPTSQLPPPAPSSHGPALSTTGSPGDLLDLRNWNLTLPTGRPGQPDTVSEPLLSAYRSPWFALDAAKDGVVFTADAGGATTPGSTYPRSELRELAGTALASWSDTDGTHTMRLRQAVFALPAVKPEVVTAQIHDAHDDVVEIRLEGTRLLAQYDSGRHDVTLDPAYVLGTPYTLQIVATGGRMPTSPRRGPGGTSRPAATSRATPSTATSPTQSPWSCSTPCRSPIHPDRRGVRVSVCRGGRRARRRR